jgi:aminomethyltransferase
MGDLKQTPLHDRHAQLGAKLVPFAGFSMPVQYPAGIIEEHRAVRRGAGMFDVSHMGEVHVTGPGAATYLDAITPSRLSGLEAGRVMYSGLTTERGTFVDDVLIYRLAEDHFLVVVNAANHDKDVAWMRDHLAGHDAQLDDRSDDTALIAVQGPKARATFAKLAEGFDAMSVKYYRVIEGRVAGRTVLASRTGYTGELGWEIFVPATDAGAVWDALLEAGEEHGITPAGLGARDTLRLEAALPLYGNDIDESTTVLEAGLEFMIDWEKDRFLGREALRAQREQGLSRKRAGFELQGKGIARHGHTVLVDGEARGEVTSGAYAPWLDKAIGMAYLPVDRTEPGTGIEIDVRGRRLPAAVTPMPFYKRPKKKKSQKS